MSRRNKKSRWRRRIRRNMGSMKLTINRGRRRSRNRRRCRRRRRNKKRRWIKRNRRRRKNRWRSSPTLLSPPSSESLFA